jgi:hypothetical protein
MGGCRLGAKSPATLQGISPWVRRVTCRINSAALKALSRKLPVVVVTGLGPWQGTDIASGGSALIESTSPYDINEVLR